MLPDRRGSARVSSVLKCCGAVRRDNNVVRHVQSPILQAFHIVTLVRPICHPRALHHCHLSHNSIANHQSSRNPTPSSSPYLSRTVFEYVDSLIDAINAHPGGLFKVGYSTPADYVATKLPAAGVVPTLPAMISDSFPYIDDAAGHNAWTG